MLCGHINRKRSAKHFFQVVYFQMQYFAEALDFFEHSLGLYGPDPATAFNQALCHFHLGHLNDALLCINQALELDADYGAPATATLAGRGDALSTIIARLTLTFCRIVVPLGKEPLEASVPMPPKKPQRDSKQTGGRPMAPHVQAALGVGQSHTKNGTAPPDTPANGQSHASPSRKTNGKASSDAATPPSLTPRMAAALKHHAPHVRAAILRTMAPQQPRPAPGPNVADGYVVYEEKKLGVAPPPASKKPVYTLHFDQKGKNCTIRNLATGQVKRAGTLFAGYVRMKNDGPLYVSPRADVSVPGDTHATIAARSPEWALGQRAVVAGGEVGIIDGEIVGHNDKTGHFQTRKNRQQSGMPSDKFYPFTVDPKDWYKK